MSKCKYCHATIIWVQKPGGAWYPPFNITDGLQSMQYELVWDTDTCDWTAEPVDKGLAIKLTSHDCESRQEFFRRQLAEKEEVEDNTAELINRIAPRIDRSMRIVELEHELERVKARVLRPEISHNKAINLAKKLAITCPVCWTPPFEWCVYVHDAGKETTNLHIGRV